LNLFFKQPKGAVELAWLVRLRWLMILFFGLVGLVGFSRLFLVDQWAAPYWLTWIFFALFNLRGYLRKRSLSPAEASSEIAREVTVDLVSIGAMLAFTGGSRSPAFALLSVPASLGALLLTGKRQAIFAVVLALTLGGLFFFRHQQIISGDYYANELASLAAVALSVATVFAIVSGLARGLRESRERAAQIRERDRRTESLLASGALAADFSHRFATPLNNIGLRVRRALDKSGNDPLLTSELRAIGESTRQCEALLREIASTTLDSSQLRFERVDVGDLLRGTVKRWTETDPGTGVEIAASDPQPLWCRAPAVLLAKAFTNLLENSAQHLNHRGRVLVQTRRENDFAEIEFCDDGPGWSAEMLQRGIRPFATTRPGGTGLGLYNTLSLCEALGGSFWIGNAPGGGASAILRLPVAEARVSE